MPEFAQVAARMFNTPLMIEPDKAAVMVQALAPRLLGAGSNDFAVRLTNHEVHMEPEWSPTPLASLLGDELCRSIKANPRRGYSTLHGVAVIPVTGTLVHRGSHVGESSGVTSYEGLRAQFMAAAEDDEVAAIAMEIDSFGGEVAGCFELCDRIREIRAVKPVYAFLAENACSAGYAIAAQASHITIPEFGRTGSIGVVAMHVDYSQNLEQAGIKVTFIKGGEKKTDGNPYEAISDDTLATMQAGIDKMRSAFVMQVAAGRGKKMNAAQALKTEAGVYMGADALAIGLVDEVADPKAAFDALLTRAAETQKAGYVTGGTTASRTTVGAESLSAIPSLMAGLNSNLLADIKLTTDEPIGGSGCLTRVDAIQTHEEANMPDDNNKPVAEQTPATPKPVEGDQAAVSEATTTERNRASTITRKVEKAGLPASMAEQMINDGLTLEQAFDKIIDAKADAATDGGEIVNAVSTASVVSDVQDRQREGMTLALQARVGLAGGEQNEYTGMSLREMARETLNTAGIKIPRGGALMMAGTALNPSASGGMHTGSDFGNILKDIANKSMLKGFDEAEESFEKFTSVGSLTDFRASTRVGMDAFPSLAKVEDGAEFQHGTFGDYSENIILATYGKLFAITRQTIINDDLDAFSKIPLKMGRASRRTIGDLVFAVINGNPKMSDNVALFHATHKNLAGSGGAPSEATFNAAITAMATQKGRGKNATALNIAPKYVLANPTKRSAILQTLNSEYAPDNTDKSGTTKQMMAHNTVHKAVEPILDARVTGNSWFMLADPTRFDTIEVAYLDGVTAPYLEQQEGWTIDGTEFKVRIDAGVAPLAWEGTYKNPGAA